jgi:ABC-2 type transport system ATP-binding protein
MQLIETKGLTKTYRRFEKEPGLRGSVKSLFRRAYTEKTALKDFDLSVREGEFVGLIGPNGAGKTTLVKLLTGIIAPTLGDLQVLGYTPNRLQNDFKRQYAVVMGQKSQLFFDLTPADTFRLFKELYGIPESEYRKNLDYFTGLFDVGALMHVQVRTLSLGERMKMELIAALLHSPKILFLDEPTIGLDAMAQSQMRAFLREVNEKRGATILLTSHYMEDIVSLCSRCVVVSGGEKLCDGPTQELFERHQTHRKITLSLKEECAVELPPQCEIVARNHLKVSFLAPKEQATGLMQSFLARFPVSDITVEEEDIASVVTRLYGAHEEAAG